LCECFGLSAAVSRPWVYLVCHPSRHAADVDLIDIAGVPGTGKTATVHAVVKELKRKAEDGVSAPHPVSPVALRKQAYAMQRAAC
jgi:Cdc6-like AAA superfamily ATPase